MPHTLMLKPGFNGQLRHCPSLTHFSSPHGVDQVPQFCLHGIEPTTARSSVQRLHPPNHGGCDNSVQFTVFIIHTLTLPACPHYVVRFRRSRSKKLKFNSKNKFHGALLIWWCFCSVVESLAPTLRNGQHNITPSTHPYKYFELLKPCPVPLQIY